jgi:hypothetical protein
MLLNNLFSPDYKSNEQKTVILTTDLGHKMSTSFISFRKSNFFEQVLNING